MLTCPNRLISPVTRLVVLKCIGGRRGEHLGGEKDAGAVDDDLDALLLPGNVGEGLVLGEGERARADRDLRR